MHANHEIQPGSYAQIDQTYTQLTTYNSSPLPSYLPGFLLGMKYNRMALFSLLLRRKARKLEDLPPYSTVPAQLGQPDAKVNEGPSTTLLDPDFSLSGATIEEQLEIRDRTFAKAIVQFVGERLDGNLTGEAGYKYTYSSMVIIALL